MPMLRRSEVRLRRLVRRVLSKDNSPQRIARGLAAGFFVTAFPLPGLQIPISILAAWAVHGNKAVAVLPQFISNAGTMIPIAYLEFWIGAKLWPGQSGNIDQALAALKAAWAQFVWSAPFDSLGMLGSALAALGGDVLGPLLVGSVLIGAAMALLSYPLALLAVSNFNTQRMRRRAMRGIGMRPPRGRFHVPAPIDANCALSADDYVRRYAIHPQTYVRTPGVKLLNDGREAYPEMIDCIGAARQAVDFETYIFRADKTGQRFAAAFKAAAARGVKVRVLFDGVGSMELPAEFVKDLREAGVHVAEFRPVSTLWRRGFALMNRRDHRKILIIDRQASFCGGLNIADDYAAREDGGGGWRDTHIRLDGETIAQQFTALFTQTWVRADQFAAAESSRTVAPVPSPGALPLLECSAPTSRNVLAQVLSNRELLQRVRLRRAYMHAIDNAHRYILIENAYFIPDRGIRRALARAVKRGVVVGVAVAKYSDVAVAAMASRALYSELLSNGVRLFEYPLSMLHCKTAVIDDVWSMVSSYNLDHRSLRHNLESGALLVDGTFAAALRDHILADIENCREVTREFHNSRPWTDALMETAAYQLRYWL